jgi:hypothetical protein
MASGASLATLRTPDHFPLPADLEGRLAAVKRELLRGRGVAGERLLRTLWLHGLLVSALD